MSCTGNGADAALQPTSDWRDEEQADTGENPIAQDSAQRGQDTHGHVQKEPSHHWSSHHSWAGEGEGQTGDENMEHNVLEIKPAFVLLCHIVDGKSNAESPNLLEEQLNMKPNDVFVF